MNVPSLSQERDEAGARAEDRAPLLAPSEAPPFDLVNPDGGRLLFICDHASAAIPRSLNRLGLTPDVLARHIAWDIGAAKVARVLAERFSAPLILSNYSRLVVDCNRYLGDPTAIPPVSDHVPIPGNEDLDDMAAELRAEAIYRPYHAAIAAELERLRGHTPAPPLISIHSFTPVFESFERPWHVGVLWNEDGRLALPFMRSLRERDDVVVGDNEPYSARENYGYSVATHAEQARLPHLLIEIRQDLIDTDAGVAKWAVIVGDAISDALHDIERSSETGI